MGLTLSGTAGEAAVRHRLGRGHERATRTIAHDVLDSPYPVVTVAPASSRRGTLRLLMADEAAAATADALIASGGVLEFTGDPDPAQDMRLVPTSVPSLKIDPTTGAPVLEFAYVEVSP